MQQGAANETQLKTAEEVKKHKGHSGVHPGMLLAIGLASGTEINRSTKDERSLTGFSLSRKTVHS